VIDMKVLIPTPLLSYTGAREVEADGATLAAVLADLDRRYPGIRFRVVDEQGRLRRHMRFFTAGGQIFDLSHPLRANDSLILVQALSGG
jgi:molybdopterin synthase sulfur carrier subunit